MELKTGLAFLLTDVSLCSVIGQYGNSFNCTTPIKLTPQLTVLANSMSTWTWIDKTPLNNPIFASDVVAEVGGVSYGPRRYTDPITGANSTKYFAFVAFSLFSVSRGDHSGTQVAILDMPVGSETDPWTWLGYIGPGIPARFLASPSSTTEASYQGATPSCYKMGLSFAPTYPLETAAHLILAGGYNCTGPGNAQGNFSKEVWVADTSDFAAGTRAGWRVWNPKTNFQVTGTGFTHVVSASSSLIFLNFGDASSNDPVQQNATRLFMSYDYLTNQEYDLTKSIGMPWPEGTSRLGVAVAADASKLFAYGGYGYYKYSTTNYVVSDTLYVMETASPTPATITTSASGGVRSVRVDGGSAGVEAQTQTYPVSSTAYTWRWGQQAGYTFDADGVSNSGGGPGANWNADLCVEKNRSVLMIWGGELPLNGDLSSRAIDRIRHVNQGAGLPPNYTVRQNVPEVLSIPTPWPYKQGVIGSTFAFIDTKSWEWVAAGPYYLVPGIQLSPGAIAGIAVGSTVVAVFIVAFGVWAGRKAAEEERNKRRKYRRWWEDPRVWGDSGYYGPDGPVERAMRESMGVTNVSSVASEIPLLEKVSTAARMTSASTIIPGLTEVEQEKGRVVQQEVAKQEKEKEAAEKGEKKGIFGVVFSSVNGNIANALAGVAATNALGSAPASSVPTTSQSDAQTLPPRAAPLLKSSGSYVSRPQPNGSLPNGTPLYTGGPAFFANGQDAGYNLDNLRGVECRAVLPSSGVVVEYPDWFETMNHINSGDRTSSLHTLVGEWLQPPRKIQGSYSLTKSDLEAERRLSTSGLSVGSRNSLDIRFIKERDSAETMANKNNGTLSSAPSAEGRTFVDGEEETTLNVPPGAKVLRSKHKFPASTGGMDLDELTLKVGDRVIIREAFEDGWALGLHLTSEQVGAFPLNHVIRI
ncbi:hypothetical protein HDU93_008267 [Gonapodya sp. JEL0774]|nr:hypothetical protein HDU93_008267 [Gonapodya sp. JEL0774]